MRKIKNIKLPVPSNTEDENNLYSLILDENQTIISIDKSSNQISSCDEDWLGDWKSPIAVELEINWGLCISFTDLTFDKIPEL
tara:strand:+ start:106 stop:354 length:249 start_codon:yes stop_codon:yes gene_type:complete